MNSAFVGSIIKGPLGTLSDWQAMSTSIAQRLSSVKPENRKEL